MAEAAVLARSLLAMTGVAHRLIVALIVDATRRERYHVIDVGRSLDDSTTRAACAHRMRHQPCAPTLAPSPIVLELADPRLASSLLRVARMLRAPMPRRQQCASRLRAPLSCSRGHTSP